MFADIIDLASGPPDHSFIYRQLATGGVAVAQQTGEIVKVITDW